MSGVGAQFGWICQFYYEGQIKGLCKQIDIQGIVIFVSKITLDISNLKYANGCVIFVFSKKILPKIPQKAQVFLLYVTETDVSYQKLSSRQFYSKNFKVNAKPAFHPMISLGKY